MGCCNGSERGGKWKNLKDSERLKQELEIAKQQKVALAQERYQLNARLQEIDNELLALAGPYRYGGKIRQLEGQIEAALRLEEDETKPSPVWSVPDKY